MMGKQQSKKANQEQSSKEASAFDFSKLNERNVSAKIRLQEPEFALQQPLKPKETVILNQKKPGITMEIISRPAKELPSKKNLSLSRKKSGITIAPS